MWIKPHSPQSQLRGLGTTRAESCFSSYVMNNRSTCWGLSRLSSLTSFSGLWKCFTIPLIASPTPSWIWPVFNSAWEEKGKQICCKTIQTNKQDNTCRVYLFAIVFFHSLIWILGMKYEMSNTSNRREHKKVETILSHASNILNLIFKGKQ